MADLTIIVEVEDNQTISHFSIPPSGKLVFKNGAAAGDLMIEPKLPTTELPFCESPNGPNKPFEAIGPGDDDTFYICSGTTGRFYYSAQIGQAGVEDPIVIIEKKQNYALDPWMAGIIGALAGAGIAYLIVKSRASKMRPRQG